MSFIDRILDWHRETKGMAVGMALAVGLLILGLWWYSSDWNSAGHAARDAVREAVGDPSLDVGRPEIHPHAVIGGRPTYRTLVCGRIEDDPGRAFAVLVKERFRRRSGPSWPFRSGDRVEAVVLADSEALAARDILLLQACDEAAPQRRP